MSEKFIKVVPVILATIGITLVPLSNWCIDQLRTCYGTWVHHIFFSFTQPLYFFSIPALFITTIVIFLPWSIFKSWLKFSAWVLPLAFLSIATTPVSYTGIGIDFYPYYRINAAHDAGVAFVVLSLLFIAWEYLRERQANKKNS